MQVAHACWRARQASGSVRPDTDIDDLMHLVNAIGLTADGDPDDAERAQRLLAVVIDGVRA